MPPSSNEVTQLLHDWSQGNTQALAQLAPLVYDELHRIAGAFLKNERAGHTLQATALVHEAYIRLVEQDQPEWHSRAHFTAVAAKYMRQILVDHARRRKTAKRGLGEAAIPLDEAVLAIPERTDDLLALDEALTELSRVSPAKARVVEMRFFGGMTQEEIAVVLGVHVNTVARQLRTATAWLQTQLS
jgi:RNA polymerase sigma factor (TIGR02999 family)